MTPVERLKINKMRVVAIHEVMDPEAAQGVRLSDIVGCERCGAPDLADDGGTSWPYCAVCGWCPDCGVSHDPHPDKRRDP